MVREHDWVAVLTSNLSFAWRFGGFELVSTMFAAPMTRFNFGSLLDADIWTFACFSKKSLNISSVRALLLRIDDKCAEYGGCTDYKEHIDTCNGTLWRELEHSKDEIFEFLLQRAEQLPHKIPFYAVLVGLINLENEDFAKTVVDTTRSRLQDTLNSECCDMIRILLQSLTMLCSNVVSPCSIVEIFETLLSSAARSHEDRSLEKKDFLKDLWDGIQVLSNNGWKVESVPRPHLSFESQLVAGSSHGVSPISCPLQPKASSSRSATIIGKEKHYAMLKYPQRLRKLNIFPSNKAENVQPIDRFVVEEYLLDVLLFFNDVAY